jgi:isocitrate dehydrogenase kinase/phosphatase
MSVTYKAVEGYPNNTYITFMPDTSIVDYYIHRAERGQKRSASKEYGEFMKKSIKTNVIRMDHLFHEF